MWIVVDANEARNGLARLLARSWDAVKVQRLEVADLALGSQVLVERKTVDDMVASLADGRLFRQARRLYSAAQRPVVIQEGDPARLLERVDEGSYRGAVLSLAVGFRIPLVMTRDLEHTAVVVRHMAAQESKRESRRRLRAQRMAERASSGVPGPNGESAGDQPRPSLPAEAIEVLCALPGVGRNRAETLAQHVASLRELAGLGVRELLAVPGIGPDTAARIVDALRDRREGA